MHQNNHAESTHSIPSTSRAHVVYDRTTGEVLHIHHTVEFPHGAPTTETPDSRALRLVGKQTDPNVAVLEVEPAEVSRPHPIRIDPQTRKVVRK